MNFQKDQSPDQAVASLKEALEAMEAAEHCAVLWFADIYQRKLYRQFGYSSMNQFAAMELQFSRTRTGDFMRLASKLNVLPVLRKNLAEGRLGPTKAQEIIKVATPKTEGDWVEVAKNTSRDKLRARVKKVKDAARKRRSGAEVSPIRGLLTDSGCSTSGMTSPEDRLMKDPEVPVRVSLEMMPDEFARYEILLEKMRKLGFAISGSARTALILDGLEALISARATSSDKINSEESARGRAPGKPLNSNIPPVQVNVDKWPEPETATITTSRGDLPISEKTFHRLTCDARVNTPGKPNKATIPPSTRRAVLTRDGYRCQAPGCQHVHGLDVHHILSRRLGGSNKLDNLITLCRGCHQLVHEMGGPPPGWLQNDESRE
jgi:hypothetical protein